MFCKPRLYTSHNMFRKLMTKKNALYNKKKNIKGNILSNPTKAAANSFKKCILLLIVLYQQNKYVLQVCYCMRKWTKILVLDVTSLLIQNLLVTLETIPFVALGQKVIFSFFHIKGIFNIKNKLPNIEIHLFTEIC